MYWYYCTDSTFPFNCIYTPPPPTSFYLTASKFLSPRTHWENKQEMKGRNIVCYMADKIFLWNIWWIEDDFWSCQQLSVIICINKMMLTLLLSDWFARWPIRTASNIKYWEWEAPCASPCFDPELSLKDLYANRQTNKGQLCVNKCVSMYIYSYLFHKCEQL